MRKIICEQQPVHTLGRECLPRCLRRVGQLGQHRTAACPLRAHTESVEILLRALAA